MSSSPSLATEDSVTSKRSSIGLQVSPMSLVQWTAHTRIKAPSGAHEADFVNRKSFHSINVQMVCNADCVISNVVAKWPGSVHDSRIFRASEIYQCLSQGEFSGVLLGDRGMAASLFS
ncbi:putative nuclease HARBI1 [Oncorhynchus nerka]|uniref:putative nuclease HARBI1 n=1 Tax=Oncorhynchus nerka TaxID=8023 RepID=UPI0031B8266A